MDILTKLDELRAPNVWEECKDLFTNSDPLILLVKLKEIHKQIDKLLKDQEIRDEILAEAERHGPKFQYKGYEFSRNERGVSYDYSHCNDSEWEEMKAKQTEAENRRKEREKWLKTIKFGKPVLIEETGELISAPLKKSTTSIEFKKL